MPLAILFFIVEKDGWIVLRKLVPPPQYSHKRIPSPRCSPRGKPRHHRAARKGGNDFTTPGSAPHALCEPTYVLISPWRGRKRSLAHLRYRTFKLPPFRS